MTNKKPISIIHFTEWSASNFVYMKNGFWRTKKSFSDYKVYSKKLLKTEDLLTLYLNEMLNKKKRMVKKSFKDGFITLTKEQVEASRSKAYKYVL